jgi:hypothetical protein
MCLSKMAPKVIHSLTKSLRESDTESPANLMREFPMTLPRLQNYGQLALGAVARCVEKDEPLLRCQLLASEFYEALKRELRQCPRTEEADRSVLLAAAAICSRAAIASTSPAELQRELRKAVDLLCGRAPMKPMLRVIQGGLSRA